MTKFSIESIYIVFHTGNLIWYIIQMQPKIKLREREDPLKVLRAESNNYNLLYCYRTTTLVYYSHNLIYYLQIFAM